MAGISLGTKLGLGQGLLMTPQLQQAIKLLQLSRLELEQFVQTQLSENPVLEDTAADLSEESMSMERETTESQVVTDRLEEASSIIDSVSKDDKPDVDWENLARYEESRNQASGGQRVASEDEVNSFENLAAAQGSIQEYLMKQVDECDFSPDEKSIAINLVGNIDDRGYLAQPLEEICASEKYDFELAEGVLDTLQRFDPPGVASRDLKECLLIQLKSQGVKNTIVDQIIRNHLHDLELRNYSNISRSLKAPLDKIYENVALIAGLEPNPGRPFSPEATQYIIPDVYVFKLGEQWVVTMNEEGLPKLKVSPFYKQLFKKTVEKASVKQVETNAQTHTNHSEEGAPSQAKPSDKEYLKEKIKTADWLIKSLFQRQSTIFRVAEKILERQKDFFEYGTQHLKPMVLRDIADALELHESTISRVTTHKYMHTPRGVFELKYFFNSSISTTQGNDLANEAVKDKIQLLVKSEDAKKPYSDQQIVEILEKENITLARRTVAKYREQMNILPSSRRRKPF